RARRRRRSAGAPRRRVRIALRRTARGRTGGARRAVGERGLAAVAHGARPAHRGDGAMRRPPDLEALAWPADRLGEALSTLARRSGLEPGKLDLPEPREASAEELDPWVDAAAAAMGLEAEPVEVAYGEVEALVE